MNGNQPVRFRTTRALIGLALVLLLLQGVVAVMSAPPPSWGPPEIYKHTAATLVDLGDAVQFTVTVANPTDRQDPLLPVPWYDVRVMDVLDSCMTIDKVSVTGDYTGFSVADNTVIVRANALKPGESFVITIDCTVVAYPETGNVMTNTATLECYDDEGDPAEPMVSDPVTVTFPHYRVLLPVALRNH